MPTEPGNEGRREPEAQDERKNSAVLRDEIDSGQTGEKVDFPDPAIAPLGTDAEAGGTHPPESTEPSPPARTQAVSRFNTVYIVGALIAAVAVVAMLVYLV